MMEKEYASRTELQKIQAQWTKLSGLHSREEWSAAVIRAATAAELAATYAIRREFEKQSQLTPEFVDSLLIWANGLSNKMHRLLLPLILEDGRKAEVKKLLELAKKVNDQRNEIAHKGNFTNRVKSTELIGDCKKFVEGLIGIYNSGFELREKNNHI